MTTRHFSKSVCSLPRPLHVHTTSLLSKRSAQSSSRRGVRLRSRDLDHAHAKGNPETCAISFHVLQLACSHDFSPLRLLSEAQQTCIEVLDQWLVVASMASYVEAVNGSSPHRQHYNGLENHPSQQPRLLKRSEVRSISNTV